MQTITHAGNGISTFPMRKSQKKNIYIECMQVCIPFLLIDIFLYLYIQLYKLHVFRIALQTLLLLKTTSYQEENLTQYFAHIFSIASQNMFEINFRKIYNKSTIYLDLYNKCRL